MAFHSRRHKGIGTFCWSDLPFASRCWLLRLRRRFELKRDWQGLLQAQNAGWLTQDNNGGIGFPPDRWTNVFGQTVVVRNGDLVRWNFGIGPCANDMLFKVGEGCCTTVVFIRETNDVVQANLREDVSAKCERFESFNTQLWPAREKNIAWGSSSCLTIVWIRVWILVGLTVPDRHEEGRRRRWQTIGKANDRVVVGELRPFAAVTQASRHGRTPPLLKPYQLVLALRNGQPSKWKTYSIRQRII